MEITFNIEQQGDWEKVGIVGPVNEDAEVHFAKLASNLSAKCIFNFQKVTYVNSCGVRAWINFLREIEQTREIVFEECTPEVVAQINMIPNFRGSAHIRSVYGSYVCPECDHEKNVLFEEGKNMPATPEDSVEEVKCDQCGAEAMELEELEDEFFQWLSAG